jgi:hypothetical protein
LAATSPISVRSAARTRSTTAALVALSVYSSYIGYEHSAGGMDLPILNVFVSSRCVTTKQQAGGRHHIP